MKAEVDYIMVGTQKLVVGESLNGSDIDSFGKASYLKALELRKSYPLENIIHGDRRWGNRLFLWR